MQIVIFFIWRVDLIWADRVFGKKRRTIGKQALLVPTYRHPTNPCSWTRHEVIKLAGGDELTCAPGGEGYRSILLSSRIFSSGLLRPRSPGRTRSLKRFHTAITAEC